ncbi:MAG: GWxTD domain-containing protein [candidate division Zixibacteria bacterium]|nr:GWxTD domain-containing protein [candidate division Zixibacteria bacterium]
MRKQIKKISGVTLLLVLTFFISPAQNQAQSMPSDSLKLNLDYSVFNYLQDPTKSYLEVYYSLEQKELDYIKQMEGYGTVISLELSLRNQKGEVIKEKKWKVGSLVMDLEKVKTSDAQTVDILGDTINPGVYYLELKVADLNSNRVGVIQREIHVPDFKGESLQFSDVQLALNLKEEDSLNVKFNKSGMSILPNPKGEYISREGMLYLYAELYNLQFKPQNEKKGYSLSYSILNSTGSNPRDYGTQVNSKPGSSAAVISALNISSLSPGEYILKLTAKDMDSGEETTRSKPFKVLTSSLKEIKAEPETEEDAKVLRNMLSYIASREELNMYDELNLAGKRQFISDFWKRNDPDPSTPENEFKIEYYDRWEKAKNRYSSSQVERDGWKTDMGRVFILYGEPDDIERHPYSISSLSWERWNYDHIQGGVYFIFLDEQGYGVYRIIHSTAKGEIKNPRWQERVDTEGASDIIDY